MLYIMCVYDDLYGTFIRITKALKHGDRYHFTKGAIPSTLQMLSLHPQDPRASVLIVTKFSRYLVPLIIACINLVPLESGNV